jgi:hypothetical protein
MREGSGPRHGGSSCCEVKTARPVAARRPFAPFAAPARYRRGVQKAPETSRCYRRLARCCESRALSFPEPRISCRNAAPAVPRAQLPQTHRHMTDDGRPTVRPWSPERLVYQHEGLSANQMALLAIMKCTPKIKTRKEKIRFTGWPTLALLEYVDDARRSAGGRWRLAMGTKSGCGLKTCRRSTIFTCCCSHRSVRPRQPVVSAPWAAVVVERYVGPFAGLLPRLGGVLARWCTGRTRIQAADLHPRTGPDYRSRARQAPEYVHHQRPAPSHQGRLPEPLPRGTGLPGSPGEVLDGVRVARTRS